MAYQFLWYQGNIQGNNLKRDKDSGEGIEGNWDYHPIYPVWPSAPPPPGMPLAPLLPSLPLNIIVTSTSIGRSTSSPFLPGVP